jgi:succinate dehydrogenase / fumarate reductase flavoprotein subunit
MENKFKFGSTIRCDVLLLGTGGAGLRCAAAIFEKRPKARIVAATKVSHPQKSHTHTAQGGVAVVDPKDALDKPIYHMFDTWKGSDCMADQNIIRKIIESSWEQILWLENHGMNFTRNQEGKLSKRTFGGHTINFGEALAFRGVYEADRTGKGMVDTLLGEIIRRDITFINQAMATELLFKGNRCVGAILFKPKEGEFVQVLAKVTVMAMGGCGQVFRVTTNCRQNTGDHLALILQSGLPVMDPEAVQFHPTGIVGPGILASESLRSVGGILRNKDQEAFMGRYTPKLKDLAPRDLVARAIETEIREGRGVLNLDHNIYHVWIDLRHLSDYVHEVQLPEVTSFFKKFLNIDPKYELCPIRPSNHFHMGGIPTNEFGEVQKNPQETVPGLFAIGECAAASFHGFNRLGTNALLELITMGKFAGEKAVEYLEDEIEEHPIDAGEKTRSQFSRFLEATRKDNLENIRETLQKQMTDKVGVFRKEEELTEMIKTLQELKEHTENVFLSNKSLTMNQELIRRWELENLLITAMVITYGARERRESRGGHFREDFPERHEEFNHHSLAYMTNYGEINLEKRKVDLSLYEAKGANYEKFGIIERKY